MGSNFENHCSSDEMVAANKPRMLHGDQGQKAQWHEKIVSKHSFLLNSWGTGWIFCSNLTETLKSCHAGKFLQSIYLNSE